MKKDIDLEVSKRVVRRFVEAINGRNWDAVDDLVASDFIRHSNSAPSVGSRDELKQYLGSEFMTFLDALETIEDILAEGDKVAVRHHFRGTQMGPMGPYPASGRVMEAEYLAIYRIADGAIAEAWAEWDRLSGLIQLGHMQASS